MAEKKFVQDIEIDKIVFDEDLYPRQNFSWRISYAYSQSMKAGAEFPLITLAVLDRKLVLVDGKHRLEANKLLKNKIVKAEVYTGWDRKKIFEESVKRNISHGRSLSPFDKRRIALKLRNMNIDKKDISRIIQVPFEKLDFFVEQRLVNTLTGQVIVKTGLKHLAKPKEDFVEGESEEEPLSRETIETTQEYLYITSQVTLLSNLISLLEGNLLDLENKKIQELLNRVKELLS